MNVSSKQYIKEEKANHYLIDVRLLALDLNLKGKLLGVSVHNNILKITTKDVVRGCLGKNG